MELFFHVLFPVRPKPPPEQYNYFAAPDGEDVPQKMRYMLWKTGIIGLGLSVIDAICLSRHLRTYTMMTKRFAYITCPVIVAGCTFTWCSNTLGSLKKKYIAVEKKEMCVDDVAASSAWNWGLGATLGSLACFAWTKNLAPVLLTTGTASLILAGVRYGDIVEYNPFYLEQRPRYFAVIHDYTLTAERERNWTSVGEVKEE